MISISLNADSGNLFLSFSCFDPLNRHLSCEMRGRFFRFKTWRRIPGSKPLPYIFLYRASRNAPIFSIFPSLTSFPRTLSTVVTLISGNRLVISSLDTGTYPENEINSGLHLPRQHLRPLGIIPGGKPGSGGAGKSPCFSQAGLFSSLANKIQIRQKPVFRIV